MARPSVFAALASAWLLMTGPLQGQTPPRPQPKKPAPAKPAQPAKPTTAAPAAPAAPAPAPAPEPPPTDVKIVTSSTQGAQVFQSTTYIKGPRQRVEFPGVISIDQCDQQRTVMLNPTAKRYRVQPYAAAGTTTQAAVGTTGAQSAAPTAAFPAPPSQPPRGGVVALTTTLTDTLERQTMQGLEARHIRTVIAKQADANACDKTPVRTQIDGWYVTLPAAGPACTKPSVQPESAPPAAGECRDRVESHVVGDVTLGFPVKMTTTTTTGEGDKQETSTNTVEVTTLEIAKLDPSLFDVPADYALASSAAELMPAVAGGASLAEALFGSTADGTSQAAPKKPGAIRIGVLEPLNKSARMLNTRVLRQDLVGKFTKAPYEALPLSGSSADAIQADATRLACDYILLGEITEVKTSKPGKMGGLLKAASGTGAPGKDVHDVKASFRLYASGATAAPRASGDVKASSGGGFTLGSALKMASFAGQMYMGMGMMGGMGGFGALGYGLSPLSALAGPGLGAAGLGYFDPRAMAMSSMAMNMAMSGLGGAAGGGDAAEPELYQTVSEAFSTIAKTATAKIAAK